MNVKWKQLFAVVLVPALLASQSYAQGSLNEDVDAELDKLYQTAQGQSGDVNASSSKAPVQVQQVTVQAAQPVTQTQVQGNSQLAAQVQKQPTTYIEASPLTESRAEQIRRARQDAELQTEQRIVEKLEQSRIDDEKRRAELLFGDKFNQLNTPVQQHVPVAQPVVVVPQEPAHAPYDREALRGEISAALSEIQPQEEVYPEDRTYFSALAGVADYPDAKNIKSQYAVGFSGGRKIRDQILVEGSFLYSNYQVQQLEGAYDYYGNLYPRITELNQYNGSLIAKYQLFSGVIRPVFGAAMSYTYRTYNDIQLSYNDDTLSSHALDLGLVTGADLELTKSFSLGLDFRYMWNLTNRIDNNFRSYYTNTTQITKSLESLNYYIIGLTGRATF